MLNKFLEDHAFTTPALKVCATGLLVCMFFGALIGLSAFAMLVSLIPKTSLTIFCGIGLLYVYFKFSDKRDDCPICDEKIDEIDKWPMKGGYCHEWCAHMLEEKPHD